MKALFSLLFVLSICISAVSAAAKKPDAFASSTQIVVVTTSNWSSPQAVLQRYERRHPASRWKAAGGPITVIIGKNGLGWGSGLLPVEAPVRSATDPVKKEGDGKAPAGVFRLSKAFGYAPEEQPGWKMPYLSLSSSVECVDDPNSKFYNRIIDTKTVSPDWGSHENEKMRRLDDLYRWGILVDYNTDPAVAGNGSCIFMHIWRGPGQPTVGCTAMPQANLETLLGWLDPERHPLLVQLPVAQYRSLRKTWHLPALEAGSAEGPTIKRGAKSIDEQ